MNMLNDCPASGIPYPSLVLHEVDSSDEEYVSMAVNPVVQFCPVNDMNVTSEGNNDCECERYTFLLVLSRSCH